MGKTEHFVIGKRNLQKEDHWEELDASYRITKPTVICFGGNGTTSSLEANAMCKIAQGLVGIKEKTEMNELATQSDVDFVGIGYGSDSDMYRMGSLTKEERSELVKSLFVPLFADDKSETLPREEIIRNFNQITLFAHCQGSVEVANILGEIYFEMSKCGITENTINEALDQMFAVSYAPMQQCICPTLQVVPMKDDLLRSGPLNTPITNALVIGKQTDKFNVKGNIAFKEDDYTISVLSSKMTLIYSNEHSILTAKRDENWRIKEEPIYGDEVSQVMGNALSRSIANSIQNQDGGRFIPKPSIDVILEETKSILADTQNDKFESALQEVKEELGYVSSEEPSSEDYPTGELNQTIIVTTTNPIVNAKDKLNDTPTQTDNIIEPEQ